MGVKTFSDIVILAGGIGERLWPASVPENPKQFLSVDGKLSFLQSSIQRALALEPEGKILVITRSSLVKGVAEQCVSLAEKSSQKDKDKIFNDLIIVAEPKPRHTCAPLVLACKMLKFFDKPIGQSTDGTTHTILTLASDHIISPIQSFLSDCAKASLAAQKGYFVCYAIPPSSPATGYGYIKAGSGLDGIENVFNIDNFKEKPDLETAKEYLKEGCYYWNSGMFAFTDDFFLNEVKKCEPSVWQAFENFAGGSLPSENKVLAHPACVDSIPSSANQEDFVSMGTTAARKAGQILENTRSVLAYELLTACQAVDIRRRLGTHGQGLSPVHEAVFSHVREKVAFMETDRELWPDILEVERMVRSGELLDIADELVPEFE